MNGNPQVCLQVEEATNSSHWRTVVVTGRVETDKTRRERAMKQIVERNPLLTPAISATQVAAWCRRYRTLQPEMIDGRKTV